jgi:hypothetical protein
MKYSDNMTPEQTAQLLAEAKALDDAYASAADGPAEAYNRDLLALVVAARTVTNAQHFASPEGKKEAMSYLVKALDQFEPWLDEQTDDPRANGWVDDKGRP